jgi:hypothetical protein
LLLFQFNKLFFTFQFASTRHTESTDVRISKLSEIFILVANCVIRVITSVVVVVDFKSKSKPKKSPTCPRKPATRGRSTLHPISVERSIEFVVVQTVDRRSTSSIRRLGSHRSQKRSQNSIYPSRRRNRRRSFISKGISKNIVRYLINFFEIVLSFRQNTKACMKSKSNTITKIRVI